MSSASNSTKATTAIYCDGACNSHTNGQGWGSVVDQDGRDLLSIDVYFNVIQDMTTDVHKLPVGTRRIIKCQFNDVSSQQVNGAELLALVAAFRIAITYKVPTINCDSQLMVLWWSSGHVNAKTRATMDKAKLAVIEECAKLRKVYESQGGKLVKIPGNSNKADLGYHKD